MRIHMQDMSLELCATHKGHDIHIEWDDKAARYYIKVRAPSGDYAYDGWAPEEIQTMEQAKKEAVKGAML